MSLGPPLHCFASFIGGIVAFDRRHESWLTEPNSPSVPGCDSGHRLRTDFDFDSDGPLMDRPGSLLRNRMLSQ